MEISKLLKKYSIPNYSDFSWKSYKYNVELYISKAKLLKRFQKELLNIKSTQDIIEINTKKFYTLLRQSEILNKVFRLFTKLAETFSFAFSQKYILELQFILLCYLNFCIKNYEDKFNKMQTNKKNLPVYKYKDEIVEALNSYRIVVIAGDTGCGKSTQVPQFLLEMGFKSIACTQPRRIACISLCKRVTQELKTSKDIDDYMCETFGKVFQMGNFEHEGSKRSDDPRDISVGYQIRFDKTYFGRRPGPTSQKLQFVTEGLLLRQLSTDSRLGRYDCIVIDEVHERHCTTDFLLGAIKSIITQDRGVKMTPEPNLPSEGGTNGEQSVVAPFKLILMSATINTQLFVSYFSDCGFVQVPGRCFPIETIYMPLKESEKSGSDGGKGSSSKIICTAPYKRMLQIIDTKYPSADKERGDVLIFLPGMAEIKKVKEALEEYSVQDIREKEHLGLLGTSDKMSLAKEGAGEDKKSGGHWIILALHGSLSTREQDRVFDWTPPGYRKCVLATNVAETSVTIDGIRFVVDSGKVKELHYDPVRKMSRLKTFWVSKAAAEQRKGRAGRTGPGVCFRLYDKNQDFEQFSAYGTSEITKIPIHTLVLQMMSLHVTTNIKNFPFIEPPPDSALDASVNYLKEQKALIALTDRKDSEEAILKITLFGNVLARLPLDITVAKMLLTSHLLMNSETTETGGSRLFNLTLTFAALLSIQSPLTSKARNDTRAFLAREEFESIGHGDPFTLFNLFNHWLKLKLQSIHRSSSKDVYDSNAPSKKWCRRLGLEEQRFYEVLKLREQFSHIMKDFIREILKNNMARMGTDSNIITSDDENEGSDKGEDSTAKWDNRRLINKLKREQLDKNARVKILKTDQTFENEQHNASDEEGMSNDDPSDIDIEDVELKLMKNQDLQKLYVENFTIKDAMMLKFIMTAGLFPQIAIPDQFNTFKRGSDLVYHTKDKTFVVIHPHSSLNSDPETYLSPSNRVTVLGYLSLLETTKPYLVNSYALPAFSTLLLFSENVHTDSSFSRFVFDDWIEVKFADNSGADSKSELSQKKLLTKIDFMSRILAFRQAWHNRTSVYYEDSSSQKLQKEMATLNKVGLEDHLIKLLTLEHMQALPSYSLKKIGTNKSVPENANGQYETKGNERNNASLLKVEDDEIVKRLVSDFPFFGYDIVYQSSEERVTISPDAMQGECPVCHIGVLTILENYNFANAAHYPLHILIHETDCFIQSMYKNTLKSTSSQNMPTPSIHTEVGTDGNEGRRNDGYYCEKCDKTYNSFSKIDILRHRKTHAK